MDREHDIENKVLPPTEAKLKKVRNKGYTIRSLEVLTFSVILSSTLSLLILGKSIFSELSFIMKKIINMAGVVSFHSSELHELHWLLSKSIIKSIAPIFLLSLFVIFLAVFLQNGFCFRSFYFKSSLNFMNPVRFIRMIFSKNSLEESARFFIKLSAFVIVSFFSLSSFLSHFNRTNYKDISDILNIISSFSVSMLLYASIITALFAFIDYLYRKIPYNRSIMMSKRELQDELREEEIDPAIKLGRRKFFDIQKENRLNNLIVSSDFIISSSNNISVILKYNKTTMKAPFVLFKSIGAEAELTLNLAKKNKKSIIENDSLAENLYRHSVINSYIPDTLYEELALGLSSIPARNLFYSTRIQKGVNSCV